MASTSAPGRPSPSGEADRRTLANVLFSATSQVAGKVLTLAWTLLAARQLDQGDFGVFFYALAVATLITAVAEWGFDAVLVREGSRAPGRLSGLARGAFALELGVSLPALAVGAVLVGASQAASEERTAVYLIFGAALLEVYSDTCRAVAQAAQRQGGTAAALIAQRLVTAVLILVALAAGWDLVGLCVGFLAGTAVGAVLHTLALLRLTLTPANDWRAEIRPLLRASWFVGASAMALIAVSKLDTVLVAALRGSEEVGRYAATYRLLDTTLFVVFALSSGLFPMMSAGGTAADAARGLRAGTAVAAAVYAPFAAACAVDAPGVLSALFGAEYEPAANALRWLALAALPYAIAYFSNAALQALDLSRWLLISAVAACALNIGLNLALIPHYGAAGAGAATAIAYAAEAAAAVAILRRRRGVRAHLPGVVVLPAVAGAGYAALLLVLPLPALVEIALLAPAYFGGLLVLMRRLRPAELAEIKVLLRRRGDGSPAAAMPTSADPSGA